MRHSGLYHRHDQVELQGPKNPEVGEDLADIVAAGAKSGEDRAADAPL
jgi:hypothetical protein